MKNYIILIVILIVSSLNNALKIFTSNIIHRKKINKKHLCSNKSLQLNLVLQEAADGLSEAFVGGTVGVMSVAFYLELKKLNEKNLEGCPYCMGKWRDFMCTMYWLWYSKY